MIVTRRTPKRARVSERTCSSAGQERQRGPLLPLLVIAMFPLLGCATIAPGVETLRGTRHAPQAEEAGASVAAAQDLAFGNSIAGAAWFAYAQNVR